MIDLSHTKLNIGWKAFAMVFGFLNGLICFSQKTFSPSAEKPIVMATSTKEVLQIDGKLNEHSWKIASPVQSFVQFEPNQGEPSKFQTTVKVLSNTKGLYIGAFCRDSKGKKGIRTPDLMRDFNWATHDIFGITIDPFLDERNAQSFQTNPYGTQWDALSSDNQPLNTDWNGFWKVRILRTDSGWFAEMEIPWKTIRYSENNQNAWGINFFRKARKANEISTWSPVPRAFNVYRMDYAGLLKGINPPPPSANIRLNPYLLVRSGYNNNDKNGKNRIENTSIKAGGEIKWAITPNTVIDATINTDFAQTELDRQVVNLSRFSIFFPEKRYFFLENSSIFSVGNNLYLQPFFSRRIGLDGTFNSKPIPIWGGLRFVHRSIQRNYGGILINQNNYEKQVTSYFGVARFSQNFGKQNRIGGMLTSRIDEDTKHHQTSNNFTYTADAFFRFNPSFSWQGMVSKSQTFGDGGDGWAGYSNFTFSKNWIYAYFNNVFVDERYKPETGFISREDFILTNPGFYFIHRPAWKPRFIRGFEPGIFTRITHQTSTGALLEWESDIFPIWILFQDGSVLEMQITPTYQNLQTTFSPLGISIDPNQYFYTRYLISYNSDRSKKISGKLGLSTGNFFDGYLNTIETELSFSPVSHLSFSNYYTINQVTNLGKDRTKKERHLLGSELRLAINPRVQLSTFYQISFDGNPNQSLKQASLNTKFSWEFKPLSFVYLVYNNNLDETLSESPYSNNFIGKVTYLKQF